MIQTERMHDCLVTVQVWNKLVQRSECHLRRLLKTQGSEEKEKEKLLKSALLHSLTNIAELLNDGKHSISDMWHIMGRCILIARKFFTY